MAKPVATQFHAAIPTCHHDDVTLQPLAFQHPQDHHTSPAFAIVILDRTLGQQGGPSVMGGASVFFVALQRFDKCLGASPIGHRSAAYRVFRTLVANDIFKLAHNKTTQLHVSNSTAHDCHALRIRRV